MNKLKYTSEKFHQLIKEKRPEITVLGEYRSMREKIHCKCSCGNDEWYPNASKLLRGLNCYKCGYKHRKVRKLRFTEKQFLEKVKKNNPDIIVKGKYTGQLQKIHCTCSCGNKEWYPAASRVSNGWKCSKCIKSNLKKGKGIIYKAINKINGKIYIGQTIYPLHDRILRHYHAIKKAKTYFAHALNKYKKEDFEWKIIDNANDLKNLNIKEEYWIKFYDTMNPNKGYNLRTGGDNSLMNQESRDKIGKAQYGEKNTGWIKLPLDEVYVFLEKNSSFNDCCKHFNISRNTLKRRLDRYNSELFKKSKAINKKEKFIHLSKLLKVKNKNKLGINIKEVINYLNNGLNYFQIANKYNCVPSTIRKRIKQFDLEYYKSIKFRNISIKNLGENNPAYKKKYKIICNS